MGDVFAASPGDIQRAARIQAEILDIVNNSVRDFHDDAARSAGWVGRDDSMARELGPRDAKEREGSEETGTALMEAIAGMARVLSVNGHVIQGAQNAAFEAIGEQTSKSGRH
ncbi:hypothetical protein ACFVS9_20510 [Streptomyces sp. NPDC058008]|uniref:hypothetical protein n=1 Tax=Streptomyces sp. NPDC058008 TaxID=3346303 RepID=UPI0036EBB4B0